jgi:hypothetical protein
VGTSIEILFKSILRQLPPRLWAEGVLPFSFSREPLPEEEDPSGEATVIPAFVVPPDEERDALAERVKAEIQRRGGQHVRLIELVAHEQDGLLFVVLWSHSELAVQSRMAAYMADIQGEAGSEEPQRYTLN